MEYLDNAVRGMKLAFDRFGIYPNQDFEGFKLFLGESGIIAEKFDNNTAYLSIKKDDKFRYEPFELAKIVKRAISPSNVKYREL